MDTGFGAKRESVMHASRRWWLKAASGYSEREDEPASFRVWTWTLSALTNPTSVIEIVPGVKDGGMENWGLRVSGISVGHELCTREPLYLRRQE